MCDRIRENMDHMGVFHITANDFHWIDGSQDYAEDLCLHGHAVAVIGNETFEFNATVSATALYLLKTLKENHMINHDLQMLPCCGFSIWLPRDGSAGDVVITGCPNGVDWSVIHEGGNIKLVTASGAETVIPLDEYKKEVFAFADQVEAFYDQCTPKILPEEETDRNGYIAFWDEWHRRRNE